MNPDVWMHASVVFGTWKPCIVCMTQNCFEMALSEASLLVS
jgi:hypothetical protein